ncbi:MAG: hypothetical protein ABFS41_02445 [Myxococcota bacterium]
MPPAFAWPRRIEWIAAGLLVAVAISMHVEFARNAGGLWRDEAHTAVLAIQTPPAELRAALGRDSFPVLSTLVLGAWTRTGWGASRTGLRTYGALVGLGILAALVVAAHGLGGSSPLVALVLVGLSPLLIRVGGSIRPYGLGMLLILLAVPALWRLVRQPTRVSVAWAAGVSLLSVHCLYQNAALLLGLGLGAASACLLRGQPRRAALVLGICGVAALSLLPYLPIVLVARECGVLVQTPLGLADIAAVTGDALRSASPLGSPLWMGAGVAALPIALWARRRVGLDADLALFCGTTIVVSTIAFVGFLLTASAHLKPWYVLPLLVVVAVCLNGALGAGRSVPAAAARVVVALAIAAAFLPGAWRALQVRQTNLDLVAADIEATAAPDDLIVVQPWYLGVGFAYHYDGPTPWTTLPPLADLSLHRTDLVKAELAKEDPIRPVLDRIERALERGRTVWVVGALPSLPASPPPALGAAPHARYGWAVGRWEADWARRTAGFLAAAGARGRPHPVSPGLRVLRYEDVRVTRFARP